MEVTVSRFPSNSRNRKAALLQHFFFKPGNKVFLNFCLPGCTASLKVKCRTYWYHGHKTRVEMHLLPVCTILRYIVIHFVIQQKFTIFLKEGLLVTTLLPKQQRSNMQEIQPDRTGTATTLGLWKQGRDGWRGLLGDVKPCSWDRALHVNRKPEKATGKCPGFCVESSSRQNPCSDLLNHNRHFTTFWCK